MTRQSEDITMPQLTRSPPITLHLGGHRTGASALLGLLKRDAGRLGSRGIAFWGPERTRSGLLGGVTGDPGRRGGRRDERAHRAAGRVAMLRDALEHEGIDRLIVSDPGLLGSLRENMLLGQVYPSAGARLRRLNAALPGIDRVVLSIRSLDAWWTSVFAGLMVQGFAPPERGAIEAVLKARRRWRQVIEDAASAFPDAEMIVWTHEDLAARPAEAFRQLTGESALRPGPGRLNATPPVADLETRLAEEGWPARLPELGGHYAPFTPDERAFLRDRHDDDLAWLRAGADRLVGKHHDPEKGPYRDRRPGHGTSRRQGQMDTAG